MNPAEGAGPGLASKLAQIHADSFDRPWGAGAFEALLGQAGVFALTGTDGLILIRVVADEAEILTLAVRPAARGEGQGGRLLGEAAGVAARAGASRLFLEVGEDNAAARALYARAGFAEVGRRAGYYTRGDGSRCDALILAMGLRDRLP